MGWLMNMLFGTQKSEPETDDEKMDRLLDAIGKACKKPIKKHAKAYRAADTAEETLALMHPQAVADAAIKTCRKVSRLVAEHLRWHAAEFSRECGVPPDLVLGPYGREVEDAVARRLMEHLAPLGEALEDYAPFFQGLCDEYGMAWDGLADKAHAWGHAGAEMARPFGPVAQVLVAIAGGYFAGRHTGKQIEASGERVEKAFFKACGVWESCMVKLHKEALDVLKEYYARVKEVAARAEERPHLLPAKGGPA
jgi:hypothetical protein